MLTVTPHMPHVEIVVPEKIYESQCVADAVIEGGAQEGRGFEIRVGLSADLVTQLRAYSCDRSDTALQENTSDYRRFCEGDYEADFPHKQRTYFALVEKATGVLASVFWLSPGALPRATYAVPLAEDAQWDTVAFRTYGAYRGIGVTSAFNAYVFDYIDASRRDRPLWLAVSTDNDAGIRLYHKLGFQDVGMLSEKRKIVMVRDKR